MSFRQSFQWKVRSVLVTRYSNNSMKLFNHFAIYFNFLFVFVSYYRILRFSQASCWMVSTHYYYNLTQVFYFFIGQSLILFNLYLFAVTTTTENKTLQNCFKNLTAKTLCLGTPPIPTRMKLMTTPSTNKRSPIFDQTPSFKPTRDNRHKLRKKFILNNSSLNP